MHACVKKFFKEFQYLYRPSEESNIKIMSSACNSIGMGICSKHDLEPPNLSVQYDILFA